jgi:hypothetical protein
MRCPYIPFKTLETYLNISHDIPLNMSAANMEGNIMDLDSRGGKPIPYSRLWNYKINTEDGCIKEIVIIKDNIPYSTFHAKTNSINVRASMTYIYELAAGISAEIPENEISSFLSLINNITYDLSKHLRI